MFKPNVIQEHDFVRLHHISENDCKKDVAKGLVSEVQFFKDKGKLVQRCKLTPIGKNPLKVRVFDFHLDTKIADFLTHPTEKDVETVSANLGTVSIFGDSVNFYQCD